MTSPSFCLLCEDLQVHHYYQAQMQGPPEGGRQAWRRPRPRCARSGQQEHLTVRMLHSVVAVGANLGARRHNHARRRAAVRVWPHTLHPRFHRLLPDTNQPQLLFSLLLFLYGFIHWSIITDPFSC